MKRSFGLMLLMLLASTMMPAFAGTASTMGAAPPTIPLPATPPSGWCYTSILPGVIYNRVGACPVDQPPPPATCPSGRVINSNVCYSYGPSNCAGKDVRQFSNLFTGGVNNPPRVFPGAQGFVIFSAVKRNEYISAEFTAPLQPLNSFGQMWTLETTSGPPVDASISSRCGDFRPDNTHCFAENVGRSGGLAAWKLPGFAGLAQCPLIPGNTYYFNVKLHDPNVQHFDCTSSTCRLGIQSNHNP